MTTSRRSMSVGGTDLWSLMITKRTIGMKEMESLLAMGAVRRI
jgi:hypothetical protein